MFKAIKDNKIIATNDTGVFPCLVLDEIIEDTEHTIEDFKQHQGEFLLKSDIPTEVYNNQIRQTRQSLFTEQADPLKFDYDEALARYGETDEKTIEAKNTWLAKKDEIRADNPYINIEDTLPEEINDLQSTSNL